MLCDRVLGRLRDFEGPATARTDGREIDTVEVHWHECERRAMRKQSRAGRDVALLLPLGTTLRHEDVVYQSRSLLIVVEVPPCSVIVARPRDAREMGVLALELGNLHVPVQITDGEIWVIPDGPVEAALARHDVPYTLQVRRFAPVQIPGVRVQMGGSFRVVPSPAADAATVATAERSRR